MRVGGAVSTNLPVHSFLIETACLYIRIYIANLKLLKRNTRAWRGKKTMFNHINSYLFTETKTTIQFISNVWYATNDTVK